MFALSACGGGSASSIVDRGGGGGGGVIIPAALTFDDDVDATSRIVGAMIVSPVAGSAIEVRQVTATLDHEIRTIINFENGLVTFSDPSIQDDLIWQSADGNNTLGPSPFQNGSYAFARIYDLVSTSGSGPVVFGVLAPTSVMPLTDTTTFTGEGFVTGAVLGDGSVSATGVSTVIIDWAGTVSAEIALLDPAPFNTIQIDGMVLTRSTASFEGGTVTLLDGVSDVTDSLIGLDNAGSGSGGVFGSAIDNETPSEAGGVFVVNGSNGTVGGGFLAN